MRRHGGDDVIFLGDGDDSLGTILGVSGRVNADGGAGRDYVGGGSEDDLLVGGTDADDLYGAGGNDHLYAESVVDFYVAARAGHQGALFNGDNYIWSDWGTHR
jgi:Ca2+-binding RTX toxin-like protein